MKSAIEILRIIIIISTQTVFLVNLTIKYFLLFIRIIFVS